jgi:hypothetical protein
VKHAERGSFVGSVCVNGIWHEGGHIATVDHTAKTLTLTSGLVLDFSAALPSEIERGKPHEYIGPPVPVKPPK